MQIHRHKQSLSLLDEEERCMSDKKRKLEGETIRASQVAFKRKMSIRQKTPSTISPYNSEKLQSSLSDRSHRRRRKETLDASNQIHGGTTGNTNENIFQYLWNHPMTGFIRGNK